MTDINTHQALGQTIPDLHLSQPPLAAGLPLVGLIPQLFVDPLRTLTEASRQHGDSVRLRIGPSECYLFTHPDHVQEILVDKAQIYTKESSLWQAAQALVGRGIGTTDGEFWRRNRRAMQPQFHRSRLLDLSTIVANSIRDLLDALRAEVVQGRRSILLFKEMRRMVSQVFLRAMFGSAISPRELDDLLVALKDSFERVDKLLWTSFLPSWLPVPGQRRFRDAVQVIDSIVYRIIEERLKQPADRDDLLNLLLMSFPIQSGDKNALSQVRDEIATMIVGTQDGPSLMLGWSLAMLCQHPDLEQRARDELSAQLQGSAVTYENASSLLFTRAVLEESLRLYVPLWLTVRLAVTDDVVGGIRVPRGSFVFLCPYLTHRHPQFWPQAEVFDPNRFMGSDAAPSHRGAYLPFGLGPHLCIGKHIGLLFGQMFVGEFMRRFRFRLQSSAPIELKVMVSLQPKQDVLLHLEAI